jgi:hypothetical protein
MPDKLFGSSVPNNVTILVLDGNLPAKEVSSIVHVLDGLLGGDSGDAGGDGDSSTNQQVGLIIYTSVVHVYQVDLNGVCSSDVYSTLSDPYIQPKDEEGGGNGGGGGANTSHTEFQGWKERRYLGSWDQVVSCIGAFFGTTTMSSNVTEPSLVSENEPSSSTTSTRMNKPPLTRKELLRAKREARIQTQNQSRKDQAPHRPVEETQLEQFLERKKQRLSNRKRMRCTGEAVSYALHLACTQTRLSASGRILLFTNGCPNSGWGSVVSNQDISSSVEATKRNRLKRTLDVIDPEQMEEASGYAEFVGTEAFENGIGVDVFCSGTSTAMGVPVLQSLSQSSGGYVLMYPGFDETQQLKEDVTHVFTKTHVSRTYTSSTEKHSLAGPRVAPAGRSNTLNGCLVDFRMPRYEYASHI